MKSTADQSSFAHSVSSSSSAAFSLASPIVFWALIGSMMTAFSIYVLGQWALSADEFATVPLTAADAMEPGRLAMLRGVEVISSSAALWAFYHYLVRPWIDTGTPPLAGLLLAGALITYVLDTTVNYHDFHMAFNKHSFNYGTWAAFFPGHVGPTRYAEAWFWGPPMYVYFGVALGTIQLKIFDALRSRAGLLITLAICFIAAFVFDLIAEPSIIQFAHGYAWPFVVGSLSLWTGTQFQFPLYESLLVAIYASLYASVLKSARDNGVSFIEGGVDGLPAMARTPLRLLAATGYATLCTAIYFGGFFVVSQYSDSRVQMPSYLMYSDTHWQPVSSHNQLNQLR